ncbi:MAG: hypothetical protein HQL22_00540 [Candidatus Omnitrophica bacterium]|nr:hypothetical protein [Candidatus Omnitrophota bacterium]
MSDIVCPHCKGSIYDEDALMCHFCGQSLNRASGGLLGGMRGAGMKWVWITIAVIVVVATIISMF